jgi:hypothetical protein
VILALDGLQPDVGHEVLWVIREYLSGEVLLARSLLSGTAKPNLNTGFGEELDLERESAKFRDAWHYVWVAPDVLAQRPAVSAETGPAA